MSQAASALAPEESFEGQIVGGKYKVGPLVGSGGMGTVWAGQHMSLGTRVAIKFIRPQFAERADARRRFEIEARAAASVDSKHAVKVYDYGLTDAGLPYIVMEFLEGESLSEALIRRGPLPADEAAKIIGQASKALAKAHAANIVHRDLKPDNIFLAENVESEDTDGLSYVVKLVDFGIAKMLDAEIEGGKGLKGPTQDGSVIGTPNFMSPEQLTVGGAPGPLTDIWSLGACTFAAFTARIPFEGEVLGDIVLKVCVEPLPVPSKFNPQAPEGIDQWFLRACHREPAKRFQSVDEMAEQLAKVCGLGAVKVATHAEDRVQYALKRASGRSANCGRMNLIARRVPSCSCRPSHTVPIPPEPTSGPTRYLPPTIVPSNDSSGERS
jgi:serine/threonine-protein kinase